MSNLASNRPGPTGLVLCSWDGRAGLRDLERGGVWKDDGMISLISTGNAAMSRDETTSPELCTAREAHEIGDKAVPFLPGWNRGRGKGREGAVTFAGEQGHQKWKK